METATNNTIPFLDTLIITDHNTKPSFTVYRKPTSNPTYIHWYSAHTCNTKIAALTTLYLRAFKICSPPYIKQETNLIKHTFQKLKYPSYIIHTAYKKAKGKYYQTNPTKPTTKKTYIPIPNINTHNINNLIPQHIQLVPSNNIPVSYTHLRAHETPEHLVCRLLLEK